MCCWAVSRSWAGAAECPERPAGLASAAPGGGRWGGGPGVPLEGATAGTRSEDGWLDAGAGRPVDRDRSVDGSDVLPG